MVVVASRRGSVLKYLIKQILGKGDMPSAIFNNKKSVLLISVLFVFFIAYVDYLTGDVIQIFIFYIIPVIVIAYTFGNILPSLIFSSFCTITWFLVERLTREASFPLGVSLWNALMRLSIFIFCSYLIAMLVKARTRQRELFNYIVHDLRTPITNLQMSLGMLNEEIANNINDKQRGILKTAIISCNREKTMIDSILSITHLESASARPNVTNFTLEPVIKSSLMLVSAWAEKRNVKLVHIHNPDVKTCFADEVLLERILVNLLSNAVKIAPEGSTVAIQTACEDGWCKFSINNHGPVIERSAIESIFDKYKVTDTKIGSGLGLSFCKLAVEAQNGRIWVESSAENGTTFFFTLPAK